MDILLFHIHVYGPFLKQRAETTLKIPKHVMLLKILNAVNFHELVRLRQVAQTSDSVFGKETVVK